MGVLLPWDRKKTANKASERDSFLGTKGDSVRGLRPSMRAAAVVALVVLAAVMYLIRSHTPGPSQTVWEIVGGRLLSYRDAYCIVDTGEGIFYVEPTGDAQEVVPTGGRECVALGDAGFIRFTLATDAERAFSVLHDGTVLTQAPSDGGRFGESYIISRYTSSGRLQWAIPLPGAASFACKWGEDLAIALTDLSAGSAPALAVLSAATGDVRWIRSLQSGAWRSLGPVSEGVLVAVLTSGATAFDNSGATAWSFIPNETILAATIIGDTTCVSLKANRNLKTLVYPYETCSLTSEGTVKWSLIMREEPLRLQSWMGKEALVVIAENLVFGLKIEDGARLFAERTGAGPVSLTGDKLLIRDDRGIRLVRVQVIGP